MVDLVACGLVKVSPLLQQFTERCNDPNHVVKIVEDSANLPDPDVIAAEIAEDGWLQKGDT